MYRENNKKRTKIDFSKYFELIMRFLFFIYIFAFLRWLIFDVYNPHEREYTDKIQKVYLIIQDELTEYYKKNGYIYRSTNEKEDEICKIIKSKYGTLQSECDVKSRDIEIENIEFKEEGMTIHGFSNPPFVENNVLVKDLFIDIDGIKGENKFGVDRAPVRIYSTGVLGGMVTPINCNKDDYEINDVPYSKICPKDVSINFLGTNIPFSFNVLQLGAGKNARTKVLNEKVSYLRADCVAFGGEMIEALEYCASKKYEWLTACYHEYQCAVAMDRKDKIIINKKYSGKELE